MPDKTRPLPPVDQVRPGLWSIPVPIPNNPLHYVLVYALETERGPYLIDAGWNTDESYAALGAGLARMGCATADVRGVLVTHIHPDHFGLAGRIREDSGAWVGMHPADATLIPARYETPEPLLELVGMTLRRAGAPGEDVETLRMASMAVLPFVKPVQPDVLIDDGDRLDVPGWDLVAIWTPGHTPGHLAFHERSQRLMLTGDHVLPRITPNVSMVEEPGIDPLGDFLRSLRKIAEFDVDEVLPAHEHRFVGLPARCAELIEHHEQRFAEVVEAVSSGATTGWEIASAMRWSRPWERLHGFMRRLALFEALAHLRALEVRGVLVVTPGEADDEPNRWALSAP